MHQDFTINTDRVGKSGPIKINFETDTGFLEVNESRLTFADSVKIEGEAYVVEGELILNLKASCSVQMPCVVCNQPASRPVEIKNFYHAENVKQIRGAQFNFSQILREEILLEVPHFIECNLGSCPERAFIKSYIKSCQS